MSTLWTPSGEHAPDTGEHVAEHRPEPDPDADLETLRQQLASTPAEVVIANHCYGMFELATIYLSHVPPMLFEARLAIDAFGALLEGLTGRLGEPEPTLREALSQLRLTFVQLDGAQQAAAQSAASTDQN